MHESHSSWSLKSRLWQQEPLEVGLEGDINIGQETSGLTPRSWIMKGDINTGQETSG